MLEIQQKLLNRETSYDKLKKEFHCSKESIIKGFNHYGISIPSFPRSRPHLQISKQDIQMVKYYVKKFKVGYQRCATSLNLHGYKISQWKVRQIYELKGYFLYEKPFIEKNIHSSKYVAPYAGQIWHTDLHFVSSSENPNDTKIIIAFIDDRTRFIVHAEIIPNKSSIHTANALRNALQKELRPHYI